MTNEKETAEFSARLREAAIARGHTSTRAKSGIDLASLAAAAQCSLEMARRYADGLALPRPRVVRAMSDWLGVSLEWLMCGDGPMDAEPDLNLDLLERCIAAVEEAQEIARLRLPPASLAPLVAELYRDALVGIAPAARPVAAAIRALHKDEGFGGSYPAPL